MKRWLLLALLGLAASAPGYAEPGGALDTYVSTGDNHWLGQSLPIDSPATIDATFRLFRDLGIRRVYWRGLEEATWVEGHVERPENCRYYEFWKWIRRLYREVDPDRLASQAAQKYGVEFWGVATLVDWGSQADVPPFNDYPFNSESRLRMEHPEWVPVDQYGVMRQGGVIDFSYPEARRALIDLHLKFMHRDGYAGLVFLTYAENHSMRFQDEFGFNEPVVRDFQKRFKTDLRTDPFTRFASREDWRRLRGEYLTEFLRELKAALSAKGQKLGLFLDPHAPYAPQPWNVPELMRTAGSLHLDLETWVREGIVDQFLVYGYCAPSLQSKVLGEMLWLTRQSGTAVSPLTSSPLADLWAPYRRAGVPIVSSLGDDEMYLERSGLPEQTLEGLKSERELLRMKTLAQITAGSLKAAPGEIAPFAKDPNPITRRLALKALAATQDPAAVPTIEAALEDSENAVRCIAVFALGRLNGPDSAAKIVDALGRHPAHPFCEMAFQNLPRLKPFPEEVLLAACESPVPEVRATALRALLAKVKPRHLPLLAAKLDDPGRYVRFTAAEALGNLDDPAAARALVEALRHEDPVVNNRAATSLGQLLARNAPAVRPLRAEMLAALEALYRQSGRSGKRPDIEWGYRPVGNALLAAGAEGEAFLQRLIDESQDPLLAGHAWKSLYIRQKPNSFSQVTEEENDRAFARRPRSMKTVRAIRLKNSFDETSSYRPDVTGMVGAAESRSGRWGAFSDGGALIDGETRLSPPFALKLHAGGTPVSALALPGIADGSDHELSFSLFREPGVPLKIVTKGYGQGYQPEVTAAVDPKGSILLQGPDGRMVESGLNVPEKEWTRLHFRVERAGGKVTVRTGEGAEAPGHGVSTPRAAVRMVEFGSGAGAEAGALYLDDVEWAELP